MQTPFLVHGVSCQAAAALVTVTPLMQALTCSSMSEEGCGDDDAPLMSTTDEPAAPEPVPPLPSMCRPERSVCRGLMAIISSAAAPNLLADPASSLLRQQAASMRVAVAPAASRYSRLTHTVPCKAAVSHYHAFCCDACPLAVGTSIALAVCLPADGHDQTITRQIYRGNCSLLILFAA
jgi:hypothetical protein